MAKRHKSRKAKTRAGLNRHHLLFQGRHWSRGRERELRNFFIYWTDVKTHDELHNAILHDVPKPSPEAMKTLLKAYDEQKGKLAQLDIVGAAEWLSRATDDELFSAAMKRQAEHFRRH